MKFTKEEVIQYVEQEDVKFIRLAFCDVFGRLKNIAILATELQRAFDKGIPIDASAIDGFEDGAGTDLFLVPDPGTLTSLPWRPKNGRVVRMYCSVVYPDGTPFESDSRRILMQAVEAAQEKGISFDFSSYLEFYLFKTDENGERTDVPYDNAGYMDVAPEDKGENVRREICLTLEEMGIMPESSHHEEGPGQNEIDFRYADPLTAADNAVTFKTVVSSIAYTSGLYAEFSPKPIPGKPGSGFHIHISCKSGNGEELMPSVISGILDKIYEMTVFMNPVESSYERFGEYRAPGHISWSKGSRSQLIRVPDSEDRPRHAELRSPDPCANPYLAFALLIRAALYGIENKCALPGSPDKDFAAMSGQERNGYPSLPGSREEAAAAAGASEFIRSCLPESVIRSYIGKKGA